MEQCRHVELFPCNQESSKYEVPDCRKRTIVSSVFNMYFYLVFLQSHPKQALRSKSDSVIFSSKCARGRTESSGNKRAGGWGVGLQAS